MTPFYIKFIKICFLSFKANQGINYDILFKNHSRAPLPAELKCVLIANFVDID